MRTVPFIFISFLLFASPLFAYKDKVGFDNDGDYYGAGSAENCASCHTGESESSVFNVDPTGMKPDPSNNAFIFSQGQSYTILVSMNSDNAAETGVNDQNGFILQIVDEKGAKAGQLSAAEGTQPGDNDSLILDADAPESVANAWSMRWRAPAAVSAPLYLYFAGVDGNGDELMGNQDTADIGSVQLYTSDLAPTPSTGCGILSVSGPGLSSDRRSGLFLALSLLGLSFVLIRRFGSADTSETDRSDYNSLAH